MSSHLGRCALLLFVAFLDAGSAPALGDSWPVDGLPVSPSDSIQYDPEVVADGQGGFLVGWQDGRTGTTAVPYAQHVDASGHAVPPWPAEGWPLPHHVRPQDHVVMMSDGMGGAYFAEGARDWWGRVSIDHLPFDTTAVAPWPALGVELMDRIETATSDAPSSDVGLIQGLGPVAMLPQIIPDDRGGMLVAWSFMPRYSELHIYVERLDASGHPAPGWSTTGVCLRPFYQDQWSVLCGDGQGGAFVLFPDWNQHLVLYASHVEADGAVDPRWPQYGLRITPDSLQEQAPGIVSDGAGGAIIAWQDRNSSGFDQPRVLRLLADGSTAPGWPVDGLALTSTPTTAGRVKWLGPYPVQYSSIVADHEGGAYLAWVDLRSDTGDVYLQRVSGDGRFDPRWPAGGLAVGTGPGLQSSPVLATGPDGGVLVAWQDDRSGAPDVYAQYVRPDGGTTSDWPSSGLPVCRAPGRQVAPAISMDPVGAALVVWTDARTRLSNIYWSKLTTTSPDTGLVTLVSADAAPDLARLEWATHGSEALTFLVQRSEESESWKTLSRQTESADVHIVYNDRDVVKGRRYRYRITALRDLAFASYPETSLEIPTAAPAAPPPPPQPPTPGIEVRALGAATRPDRVTLTWLVRRAVGHVAEVLRSDPGAGWKTRAQAAARAETLSFEDTDVLAGHRYGYSLAFVDVTPEVAGGEQWVDVPEPPRLSLVGATPNPAIGHLTVTFSLADPSIGRLALVDVSGRRVWSRDVGSLGPGRHALTIDLQPSLGSGLYFLELRQGAHALSTKVLLSR